LRWFNWWRQMKQRLAKRQWKTRFVPKAQPEISQTRSVWL
jgi:hypothetical protein